ncbi:MAG TPA: Bcr/CflA family drug resistance efflux transporter [Rhodospirillaceae bacterium]|nr:Bcr/CflA family drug resistance efflux transporter [Rhodospirillaceae bacterium]
MTDSAADSAPAPVALLVALMVVSQVAITIFLPSLPSIAEDLGTSQALVQMTISAYLGSFALAQLVVGPLSDAIGRRRPLIAGLVLFTLGGLACALAPNITFLVTARVVQAVGGCACIVISRAIVRDTTDGPAATRAMAYLGMSLAVAPMVAPLVGGQLEMRFGWQSSFLATALMGGGALVATLLTLKETLPPAARQFTRASNLISTYLNLSRMVRFMGYSLSAGAMAATFQAFLAGTPIAFIIVMGVSPETFGFFLISAPAGYIVGNFIASRLARTVPRERMIWIGGILSIAGTSATVALALGGLDTPTTLILPVFIYSWGSGFLIPNSLAGALTEVEPAAAGSASALGGFIQMGAGFLSTLAIASLVQTSFLQIGLLMLGCSILSWLFFNVMVRSEKPAA